MNINEDFTRRSKIRDAGRWYITRFVKAASESLPSGSLILDAGAGECAYKRFFGHCQYRSVDLAVGEEKWNYHNLDYIAPLHDMPLSDNSFDAVLCTEVLEHLEWPRESIREIYRILRPGGRLFLTVPMAHAEHQVPYDFFRYTSYGLRSMCQHSGFSKISVTPFGGMFVRWAYELPDCKSIFPPLKTEEHRPNPLGMAFFPLKAVVHVSVRALQFILITIDPLDKAKSFPLGWGLVAEK
jgi:SAM-dependent methyltransferase